MPGPDQRLKGVVVVTAEMVMVAIRGHQQVLQPEEAFPVIRQHILELFPERLEVIRERMSEWTRARTNKTQHDLLVGGRQGAWAGLVPLLANAVTTATSSALAASTTAGPPNASTRTPSPTLVRYSSR